MHLPTNTPIPAPWASPLINHRRRKPPNLPFVPTRQTRFSPSSTSQTGTLPAENLPTSAPSASLQVFISDQPAKHRIFLWLLRFKRPRCLLSASFRVVPAQRCCSASCSTTFPGRPPGRIPPRRGLLIRARGEQPFNCLEKFPGGKQR